MSYSSGDMSPGTRAAVDISDGEAKPSQRAIKSTGAAPPASATAAASAPATSKKSTPTTAMATASQLQQSSARSASAAPAAPTRPAPTASSSDPPRQPACVSHRTYEIQIDRSRTVSFEVDSRYKCKAIVGKGAYGLVVSAEDTAAREAESSSRAPPPAAPAPAGGGAAGDSSAKWMVAVKKVLDPFNDHTDCKRLLREIRLLRSLRHPNVLHLTDIMPPPSFSPSGGEAGWNDVYLVTRLFDTNLHRVIYSGHALTDAHVQYILWQIFRALRYIHAAGVVHRDMKPTNVLLNRDCELALADFGLARHMPHAAAACRRMSSLEALDGAEGVEGAEGKAKPKGKMADKLTKYVVTRWYRAPELLVQNKEYDEKVDMWSVGCILAELLGSKALFQGTDSLMMLKLIIELLGIPPADELAAVHNSQAVSYIRSLRHKSADPSPSAIPELTFPERLTKLFPRAPPLLLDLLHELLQFDPRKRPTAEEALAHPYLAAYKDAPEEDLPTPEIEMSFEKQAPSIEDLRDLIWEEIVRYHPEVPHAAAREGGAATGADATAEAAPSVLERVASLQAVPSGRPPAKAKAKGPPPAERNSSGEEREKKVNFAANDIKHNLSPGQSPVESPAQSPYTGRSPQQPSPLH